MLVEPKRPPPVAGADPKAGLFAVLPNNPPPVVLAPKGDEVLVVLAILDPKPPKPVPPVVAVEPPNNVLPLVFAAPKGLAPPNGVVLEVPKAEPITTHELEKLKLPRRSFYVKCIPNP